MSFARTARARRISATVVAAAISATALTGLLASPASAAPASQGREFIRFETTFGPIADNNVGSIRVTGALGTTCVSFGSHSNFYKHNLKEEDISLRPHVQYSVTTYKFNGCGGPSFTTGKITTAPKTDWSVSLTSSPVSVPWR